jgi:hypothetical protein
MKINRVLGMALGLVVVGAAPMAFADNVVVGTQPAAPAPVATAPSSPAPVVVQPAQPVAAQPVVVDTPAHRSVVNAEVQPTHSYMGTIAGSAFAGGAAGALVGAAIYFLGSQTHPYNIAYWAAGGVLVGTGVGIAQVMVQESRVDRATAMATDPAPTLRLALYQTRF